MFKRIVLEEWANLIPMIVFGVLFTIFLINILRAIRIGPKEREHMANLPFSDSDSTQP